MADIKTNIPEQPYFLNPLGEIIRTVNTLPHWYQPDKLQFVTFRFEDSLPASERRLLSDRIKLFHKQHPGEWSPQTQNTFDNLFSKKIMNLLDNGYGNCWLKNKECRDIVEEGLLFRDREGIIELGDYVIMPNHVHFLACFHESPEKVLPSLMRYTAGKINELVNRRGTLWNTKFFDRLIRSETHLMFTRNYIANNPRNLPPESYTLHMI